MPVKKISISEFLALSFEHPVIDVRSPGEYNHAHIPGAYSLPLFSDEERKIVGTSYKQQGKQKAIKLGVDYFGVKMSNMIEAVESIFKNKKSNSKTILVHCWRGGMRSAGVAWLLDLYGFEVYTLSGGYKAFRNWTLAQFSKEYNFKIIGGFTGSAKTELLQSLGENIIDLEGLAHHKGSAFGSFGQPPQPSQEMFENKLAVKLFLQFEQQGKYPHIWLEDESQRIGTINIPHPLWKTIRNAPLYFIDIPFEERLEFILKHYGKIGQQDLVNSVMRIQKRLGPLETKTTINLILEDNIRDAFAILLHYYDKHYYKAMLTRENINNLLNKIPLESTDDLTNKEVLLSKIKEV
jgi:tRNA 2-selenouridine synthase